MTKSQSDLINAWLEKARRDLITANRSIDAEEVFTDIICFYAQQASEKYLKALLLSYNIVPPRIHSLGDLVLITCEKDPIWMKILDPAIALTPYAVEVRYPDCNPLSYQDAESAIKEAMIIQEATLNYFI